MPDKDQIHAQVEGLATLLVLDDEIRRVTNLREFAFFTTNETHRLIAYHTGYLWQKKEFVGTTLVMQSGTAEIDIHAPTNQWLKFFINRTLNSLTDKKIHQISSTDPGNEELAEHWPDTLPHNVLWCPLISKSGEITGGLIFFRENPYAETELKMIAWLISTYQYLWNSLFKPKMTPLWERIKNRPVLMAIAVGTCAILLFPVHLSVIGSGTVVPKDPVLINAPMQGIIKTIPVEPGNQIQKGELLFSMDKTDLQSNTEVSEKDLLLTKTKLRAVINEGFTNKDSNSEIPILEAQLAIDEAHYDYNEKLLGQADVDSPINGVVIFDNKDDLIGQPVKTGEKILVVANPNEVELKVTIPVSEMIKLQKNGDGEFFMYGALNPLDIKIKTLGYNAKIMPNRLLAYQLVASFNSSDDRPQIGTQGSVKLYGHYVPLFYYFLRKPLQAMRQNLGI